jgi:hypothetical protein
MDYSFSKLGLESSDFGDYDADFYVHIRDRVKEFYHQSLTGNCILDDPFTLEEIKLAIGRAKKGKSVGIDGIMNETFMYGGDMVATFLLNLFNRIFDNEEFPLDWARGLVVPIFKGGSEEFKLDPNKYHGITSLSIVGKIYTTKTNESTILWKAKVS